MAKASLAIATAFLAATTVFASAGGLSYESRGYGGPLYVGPNFHSSDKSSQEQSKRKRSYRAGKKREAPAEAKKVETAKVAPVPKEADSENSSISQASLDTEKTAKDSAAESAPKDETKDETKDEPKTTQSVGCKKYFPTAAMTVSVPCE